MNPFCWRFWRLGFATVAGMNISGYRRLFWRFYWRTDRHRVSGAEPRADLPCDWCQEVRLTAIHEIWCEAEPVGYLARICRECSSSCAGS